MMTARKRFDVVTVMSPTAGTMPGRKSQMNASSSTSRQRRLPARLLTASVCAFLVAAPLAARAQTSTLPPTDISNQTPTPSPGAAPPPAPPPALPPEIAPPVAPVATPVAPALVPVSAEPLAGFSDGNAFLRSPDNDFILFPSGRLQVDTYLFRYSGDKNKAKIPNNTFLLRRARLELGGWVGSFVYFWLAGDFALGPPAAAAPVTPSNLATTDDFVALAPWKNLAILQVGQFDAPFTLENRTSDKYFDFMERSITVRAFGIPDNKEMGAMLHGFNDDKNFYYSLGVFKGDGPLHDVEIGGSFWTGDRSNTLAPNSQTTQAGFTFWNAGSFAFTPMGGT